MYLVANTGGPVTSHCQVNDITKFHMDKSLIMPLTIWNCVLLYKQNNYFSEKQLALPRNFFHNRFPGSNFLQPSILTGSKLGFQVTNLLLHGDPTDMRESTSVFQIRTINWSKLDK